MMDLNQARERMVREQLIPRGINDLRVLSAMRKVPRHWFMEEALWGEAYSDYPVPIGEKQTISQPYIVALMTQALELKGQEKVLEIGTGSGYQTAILAELSRKVYSIERIRSLFQNARRILDQLKYLNVVLKVYDGTQGWPEESPFDAIVVTASFSGYPGAPSGTTGRKRPNDHPGGRPLFPNARKNHQNQRRVPGRRFGGSPVCQSDR